MKYQILKGSCAQDEKGRWRAEVMLRVAEQGRPMMADTTGRARDKDARVALQTALLNAFDGEGRQKRGKRGSKR